MWSVTLEFVMKGVSESGLKMTKEVTAVESRHFE